MITRDQTDEKYLRTLGALRIIQRSRKALTEQQYRTLKGQCLAGNYAAALKGLEKILHRNKRAGG